MKNCYNALEAVQDEAFAQKQWLQICVAGIIA
jgi:hypothetical protein